MLSAANKVVSGGTPLWFLFVVAFLGVVGTLSAAVFTQIYQARKESQRSVREDQREATRWTHERTRESEIWKREDEARFWEHRRSAYIEFLAAHAELRRVGNKRAASLRVGAASDDEAWIDMDMSDRAGAAYEDLLLFGSREARVAASDVWDGAIDFFTALGSPGDNPNSPAQAEHDEYVEALKKLRAACRLDLGIEETPANFSVNADRPRTE